MKLRFKILALTILLGFIADHSTSQNCPNNADFELGNSSNWVCKTGGYGPVGTNSVPCGSTADYPISFPTTGCINNGGMNAPANTVNDNRHTLMGPGAGNDPNSIAPIVSRVAPPALFPSGINVYSFRVGNDATGGTGGNPNRAQAEAMRFQFVVNANNAGFTYLYAAFLQDPNHLPKESPRFEVRVSEVVNGVDQLIPCGFYKVIAGTQTATFNTGANGYKYTDWTKVGLDLTGYIGRTIAIEFSTADCIPGGGTSTTCTNGVCTSTCTAGTPGSHSAYAYIDAYCLPLTISAPALCANTSSIQICAPPGYPGYTWPAGQPGLTGSPTTQCVTINAPVAGTIYTVNMTSVTGCPTSTTVTLKGFDFTLRDTVLCPTQVPSFTACVTPTVPGNYTVSWAPSTGLSCSNCYCPSITPPPAPGSITYTVTLTDPSQGGCVVTKTMTVTSTCGPIVSTIGANICPGACATLSATGSNGSPPYSYQWQPSGLTGAGPHTVCPAVTTTYTVTITDAGGSTYQDTAVVTVRPQPVISTTATNICPTFTATLTASGAQTYTWATGTTPVYGPTVTATPPVTTTYTVTGTSSFGCTGNATAVVQVYPLPTITAPNLVICKDSTGTLIPTGGVGNYTWTPGGVTTNLTVTPTATGITTYTVCGASVNGCTNCTTVTVTANDCSKPNVSLTGGTVCAGNCFTLNAQATGAPPLSYTWTPNIGTGPGPYTVCPQATTSYTVIVSDYKGETDTAFATIVVNPLPVITATSDTICTGSTATLTAAGGSGNLYTWIASTGGNPLTGQSITVNPTFTTTYTVTGRDANGCENTTTTSVFVNPLPVITTLNDTVCQGISGTVSAGGALTYTWLPSTPGQTFTTAPNSTTTYTVVGTDVNQCVNSATAVIIVQTIPTITANNPSICEGSSTTINASGVAFYTWLPQNTNGPSLTDSPMITSTYTIIGATSAGCTNSAIAVITVNPVPIIAFSPDTSGCVPLAVQFINSTIGPLGATCIWNYGDGSKPDSSNCQPFHIYRTPGTYSVSLTVRTQAGCSASLTIPNMITVYPLPVAGFTANPTVTEILDPKIIFTNTSTGDTIRIWTFGDGTGDSTNANVVEHNYEDTGTFYVCLEVLNGFGCRDSICQTVIIKPVWSFYIPNAFTPNGDGKNEIFNGKGENIHEYELYIYDRWGNLIFESNSLNIGWDGRANNGNEPAQQDVYVYVVKFKDVFNKKHKYVGHVTLVK